MAAKFLPFLRRRDQRDVCKFCSSDEKDEMQSEKEYLLESAVKAAHDQCVEALIKAGLDLNSSYVTKAFTLSASQGKHRIVDSLIKVGVNVNKADTEGTTALMIAASKGLEKKEKMYEMLCSDSVMITDDKMIRGNVPASEGHTNSMKLLIEAGANVNMSDSPGDTAINLAAYHGNAQCLKLLASVGADVNHSNNDKDTPLLSAAKKNRCECIRILVQAGADVNIKGEYGYSALMSVNKCPVCVELLLEAGADVNSTNKYGQTPLLFSINPSMESLPCMKLLLQHGADVNCVSKYGDTPLTCAMEYSSWSFHDIVAELIEAGADVNLSRHRDGFTPLMLAAQSKNDFYVSLLLRSGAKINIYNKRGENALKILDYLCSRKNKLLTLLFAAGEKMDRKKENLVNLPFAAGERLDVKITSWDNIKWLTHPELNLKRLCREEIRKHLLEIDLHHHLFDRIPKLGLPTSLNTYLLYNQTLDKGDDDNDNNN